MNAASLADKIDSKLLQFNANEAWIDLPLEDDEELTIYFDAPSGEVAPALLDSARSLMRALDRLDRQVQDAGAAEAQRTGLHPRNFAGRPAYIYVFAESAVLTYFGTQVNTDWDEEVRLQDGEWVYGSLMIGI